MTNQIERLDQALAGRYRIRRVLGRNGFTVYLAHDVKHDRDVRLWVTVAASAAGDERFLHEISLVTRLVHPHILPVLDSGRADEFLYYVEPHVGGESLRHRLRREKRIPIDDALKITRQVAEALNYAHSHGIVHGSVKPETIFLAAGAAQVADFGWMAGTLTAAGAETLTGPGFAIGTPEYMSPEQAVAAHVDHRSDVYSLACVLHEMLSGDPVLRAADLPPSSCRSLQRGAVRV